MPSEENNSAQIPCKKSRYLMIPNRCDTNNTSRMLMGFYGLAIYCSYQQLRLILDTLEISVTLRLSGGTPSVGAGCSLIGAVRLFPLSELNNEPIRISYLSTE